MGGLSANTHYYFRVRAFNNIGSSGYTNTADTITLNQTAAISFPSRLR